MPSATAISTPAGSDRHDRGNLQPAHQRPPSGQCAGRLRAALLGRALRRLAGAAATRGGRGRHQRQGRRGVAPGASLSRHDGPPPRPGACLFLCPSPACGRGGRGEGRQPTAGPHPCPRPRAGEGVPWRMEGVRDWPGTRIAA